MNFEQFKGDVPNVPNFEKEKISLLEKLRRTSNVLKYLAILVPAAQANAESIEQHQDLHTAVTQIEQLADAIETEEHAAVSYEEKLREMGLTADDDGQLVFSVISEQTLGTSVTEEAFQRSQDLFETLLNNQAGISLAERSTNGLEAIYSELELHAAGIMDPDTRPELGEFVPVDYYIVTSNSSYDLVNIDSGEVETFSIDDVESLKNRVSEINQSQYTEHE